MCSILLDKTLCCYTATTWDNKLFPSIKTFLKNQNLLFVMYAMRCNLNTFLIRLWRVFGRRLLHSTIFADILSKCNQNIAVVIKKIVETLRFISFAFDFIPSIILF